MSGINLDHLDPMRLCFVGQETVELSERPTMHTSLAFPFLVGNAFSNVSQVLKDNGTAGRDMLNNPLAQHMVMVFSLPKQLTRKLFQVPFSRFGATLLKLATETKYAAFLFFPASFSQESPSGGHSGSVQSEIDANYFFAGINNRIRDRYNDMQEVAMVMEAQISATHFAANVLPGVFGNGKLHFLTTCHTGKATGQGVPLDPIRTLIVANGSG
jgi:hypothetical protein